MYKVTFTKTFKRDVKRCIKRRCAMNLLDEIVELLRTTGRVPAQYKPHKLQGEYEGYWECHIRPDWLLVWSQNDEDLVLLFMRIGTHSDLFKK